MLDFYGLVLKDETTGALSLACLRMQRLTHCLQARLSAASSIAVDSATCRCVRTTTCASLAS
jgi:hypothetical protein